MKHISTKILTAVVAVLCTVTANAQRAGQSISISTGTVTAAQPVDLKDGNALKGAVLGGAVGSAVTRSSKGSSRRDRNAMIGAVVGARSQASKRTPGTIYSVSTLEGPVLRVATEQTEIRVGDCVNVEQGATGANIRRVAAGACDRANQDLMSDPEIVEENQEEASECAAAKESLVQAEDDAAMDRAIRKIEILCYD